MHEDLLTVIDEKIDALKKQKENLIFAVIDPPAFPKVQADETLLATQEQVEANETPKPDNTLLETREQTHGVWRTTASIAQRLKMVTYENRCYLTFSQNESMDLIFTKIARIYSGNPNEADHWDDIAGYAELSAIELRREK